MTGDFDFNGGLTVRDSVSLFLSPTISRRVTKLQRFTAEIYMFLLEYNQRHKGASLVHHCRVQLCQR